MSAFAYKELGAEQPSNPHRYVETRKLGEHVVGLMANGDFDFSGLPFIPPFLPEHKEPTNISTVMQDLANVVSGTTIALDYGATVEKAATERTKTPASCIYRINNRLSKAYDKRMVAAATRFVEIHGADTGLTRDEARAARLDPTDDTFRRRLMIDLLIRGEQIGTTQSHLDLLRHFNAVLFIGETEMGIHDPNRLDALLGNIWLDAHILARLSSGELATASNVFVDPDDSSRFDPSLFIIDRNAERPVRLNKTEAAKRIQQKTKNVTALTRRGCPGLHLLTDTSRGRVPVFQALFDTHRGLYKKTGALEDTTLRGNAELDAATDIPRQLLYRIPFHEVIEFADEFRKSS